MPGILKESWSSSSESVSSSDNDFSDGSHLSYKESKYPAASFPAYNEKPLNEQLEPIAVCGMGMSRWNFTKSSWTHSMQHAVYPEMSVPQLVSGR